MNETEIQAAIFREWGRRGLRAGMLMPRYTPPLWWEADIARLMPSGGWQEVEIKVTKADFVADAKKSTRCGSANKHGILSARCTAMNSPNRFWFALPKELAEDVEVPEWAGLIVAGRHRGRAYARIRRRAPLLHKDPRRFEVPDHTCYYRMWRYIERIAAAGDVAPVAGDVALVAAPCPIPEIRRRVEAKISQTNIPLHAARVWVEALSQVLDVLDSVESDQPQ